MEQKTAREIQRALTLPFAPEDLEWRLQTTLEDKMRGLAVPYVTNRAIQNRLDEVVGPDNWYNDYKPWHGAGKKEAFHLDRHIDTLICIFANPRHGIPFPKNYMCIYIVAIL